MQQLANRQDLRARLRRQRNALTPVERLSAADGVLASLEHLPEFLTDLEIGGYWAVAGELPLHRVLASVQRRAQHYHLPVVHGDGSLRFAPWRPGQDVVANRYGIPEPVAAQWLAAEALELVLVPLLGFDRRGNRLGSGAGYYDRSFAFLREGERPRPPLLVGVAYAMQEIDALIAEAWDVPLDFVATERELIECVR